MKQSMYKSRDELPMFLTVMEVAGLLGTSRASAYELVREDNFPKLKIVQGLHHQSSAPESPCHYSHALR